MKMTSYSLWYKCRIIFITSALFISLQSSSVAADYILNFRFDNYFSADNTDADGVCCNNAEINCATPCNVLVILCLRPFQSNLPRDLANCPILTVTTPSIGVYTITQPWPGAIQMLMFVVESDGNLVDVFEIDHQADATQLGENVVTDTEGGSSVLGLGGVLVVSLSIQCVVGFHGPNCDCQNTDDSTGHFTCTATGDIVCLVGYQNPDTNCIECVTATGCSDIGGFCEQPGDCICHDGYSGDNCDILDIPSSSLVPSRAMPMSTIGVLSTLQSMAPSPVTIPPSTSEVISLPVVMTSSTPASPVASTQNPSLMQSTEGLPVTTPLAVQTTLGSDLTSVIVISSSPLITGGFMNSNNVPSQTPTPPQLFSMPIPQLTSMPTPPTTMPLPSLTSMLPPPTTMPPQLTSIPPSPPLTSLPPPPPPTSMPPPPPPQPTSMPPTSMPSPPPTSMPPPQPTSMPPPQPTSMPPPPPSSMPPPQPTSMPPPQPTSMPPPQPTSMPPPQPTSMPPPQPTSMPPPQPTSMPPPQPTSMPPPQPTSMPPPPPTSMPPPPPPTSMPPPQPTSMPPPQPTGSTGNVAVIAGSVVVIFAVVVLVIITIPCVYFIMKRKRSNRIKQEMMFLDQVYNAPVTFINPGHEQVAPRSPQLLTSGGEQKSGSPLEVSQLSNLPIAAHRMHRVPYAETGHSSDHTNSPDEATIIANPHSSSRNSNTPRPSTPVVASSSNPNRRSGLGFDYKDDPVGDVYLSTEYGEKPHSTSAIESAARITNSPQLSQPPPLPPPRGCSQTSPEARKCTRSAHRQGDNMEDEEEVEERACHYLQAAKEEGDKRHSAMKDVNFFPDINLDMTTQTEL